MSETIYATYDAFSIMLARNCRRWLAISALLLATTSQAQTPAPIEIAPDVWRVGVLEQPAITESSGLARSKRYPGVYWTHNDGGPTFLFAINEAGQHLGAYQVQGAALIDWEAITIDDAGDFYLADTGTNGMVRSHSAVHRLREPDMDETWGPARVLDTWYIRFPGEREDCEGLFVVDGFAYLVAKYVRNGTVPLFRFALSNHSDSILLEHVANIPAEAPVSDAAISPDRTRLLLVTERGMEIVFINGNPASAGSAPRRFTPFENTIMEGGAFSPAGILATAEVSRDVLLFSSPSLAGAPEFSRPLPSRSLFVGDRFELSATAVGFPPPSYRWSFQGAPLPGATNSILILTNLALENAGAYTLTASNAAGTARLEATLTVSVRTEQLYITEVMSSEAPNPNRAEDWWELTSFDSRVLNLSGWKFNDSTGGIEDAFTIPQGISIRPGESIVFVENLSPAAFRAWWGADNVGTNIQIVTYSGATLSFRAAGDSLRLWKPGATNDSDIAARVDFGLGEPGISFGFDPGARVFGGKSVLGQNGAFKAALAEDIGSPGRVTADQVIELSVRTETGEIEVTGAVPGERYVLERSTDLISWKSIAEIAAEGQRLRFDSEPEGIRAFYRVLHAGPE